MSKKPYHIQGLKCDACDWADPSILLEDYPKWLNAPCPKCGANVLTQEDFDMVTDLIKISEKITENFTDAEIDALKKENPDKINVEFNGQGWKGAKFSLKKK
jgi:hypothetical protein